MTKKKPFYKKKAFQKKVEKVKAGYGKASEIVGKLPEYQAKAEKALKKVKKDFDDSFDFDITY